jgi:hypothetical protein
MKTVNILIAIARADFLERFRRYSTLITLAITIYATYVYLPPASAGIVTFNMGGYRGIYNSAWIGSAVAVMTIVILSLPGFYLIKNAIQRDRQTGVGQILATTPLTRLDYLLGKTFSNTLYLAAMAGVILLAAVGMQLLRAESLVIQPWDYLGPYLLATLPWMIFLAALAVLFEATPGLRGGLGNVIFFFLYVAGLTALGILISGQMQGMMSRGDPGTARFADPMGLINVFAGMLKAGKDSNPAFTGGLVIGSTPVSRFGGLHTFVWQGVRWDVSMLLGRLLWLGVGLLLACLAALPFDRFDPSREKLVQRKGVKEGVPSVDIPQEPVDQPEAVVTISAASLTPAKSLGGAGVWASLLISNLRLMIMGLPWWWYAVFAGLWVATLVSPLQVSRSLFLPLIWLWPILLWSSLGCREKMYRTGQLLFSTPSPLAGQSLAAWGAGLLLALAAGSGAAVRMLLGGQPILLVSLLAGAVFIPSLALAVGSWTGSSKAFEVIYVVLWYLGPINHLRALDFIGTADPVDLPWPYLVVALALLTLGLAGRWKQLREVE